jgi:hypothetical protein
MPKNKVSDLITDQEMVFVRLILSGRMTDQQAAEAAGLNPATAAYTKSKPRVRAYMLEHRALMLQQLAEQEAEDLRRRSLRREQVLDRLWELATMGPEITRGSLTGQVKALSMIVAIEGLIPDRRAGSAEKQPAPPPAKPQIYESEWLREQRENNTGSQTNPALNQDEAQDEDAPGVPQAEPAPVSAVDAPRSGSNPGAFLDPAQSTFANRFGLSETQWAPDAGFAPDTRVPFSIKKNPFARRRR